MTLDGAFKKMPREDLLEEVLPADRPQWDTLWVHMGKNVDDDDPQEVEFGWGATISNVTAHAEKLERSASYPNYGDTFLTVMMKMKTGGWKLESVEPVNKPANDLLKLFHTRTLYFVREV